MTWQILGRALPRRSAQAFTVSARYDQSMEQAETDDVRERAKKPKKSKKRMLSEMLV